jgi:hypothetical protein
MSTRWATSKVGFKHARNVRSKSRTFASPMVQESRCQGKLDTTHSRHCAQVTQSFDAAYCYENLPPSLLVNRSRTVSSRTKDLGFVLLDAGAQGPGAQPSL